MLASEMVVGLPARTFAVCVLLFALRRAACDTPKLSDLLEGDTCITNSTTGSILCSATGTVLRLSGLHLPLSQSLTLRASPAGSVIVLQPDSPLVIGPTGSLTLQGVSVSGITFSESPLNPALSLAWSGITLQPGAQLTVTSSVLALDCPTWTSLLSAVCDYGLAPGDSQVRPRGRRALRHMHASMGKNQAAWPRDIDLAWGGGKRERMQVRMGGHAAGCSMGDAVMLYQTCAGRMCVGRRDRPAMCVCNA